MNTTSNITAMQTSGVQSTSQGPSSAGSPQGLLGFLEAFLQQMQAGMQAGMTQQSGPQGLNMLAEKIAGLLKKDGISADQIQNMSPQDLASEITKVLQQQNITLPANISADDLSTKLAALIQQKGGNGSPVKSGLTSDLASSQATTIQDGQTKDDIAKKIAATLEQQQQSGAPALTPVQFHQLEVDFKQLQSAPGTISSATMDQLTGDLKTFLGSQGISQAKIAGFLNDLTQSLQQSTQTAAATTTTATTVQPDAQTQTKPQASTDADSDTSLFTPHQWSLSTQQRATTGQDAAPKDFTAQADKATQILGGKAPQPLGTDKSSQSAINITQQQQQAPSSLPQQSGNLTAKISGMGLNPAMINDLAGGDSSSSGFSGGFGQNSDAQQSQDLTNATLLQPMSADMLQTQNFTNYMNSAPATSQSGQPSPTTQLVSIQIQNNFNAGINSMTLQLEPAELGKMNVKLSFAKDGTVKAHMTVDKPETLALLQKDSSHLQRALQQTGLTTDENSLSFDLRQQSQQQNFNGYNGHGGGNSNDFDSHMDGNMSNALQAQLAVQSSGYITQSGVNIMV